MESFLVFHRYMGSGLILIWYFVALIVLYLKEERRKIRVLFLYLPLMVLLLFFNPLFYALYDKLLGGETIFRVLWLIPVSVTIAYCVVFVCGLLKGKKRATFMALSFLLIISSGTLVYRNPLFSKAENIYHVPSEVVEICDKIRVEGREVIAAFPTEFLLYVRQYSTDVCMPYGRDSMQGIFYDEFYHLMLAGEIHLSEMVPLAKQAKCHYVIFSDKKSIVGNMEDYGYEFFGRVGDYLIYRDPTMDFRNTMD